MSYPLPSIPGFRMTLSVVGVAYVLLAMSMLLQGVEVMGDFGVADGLVASPVFEDFFLFFYEMMAFAGVLMALLGHVCTARSHQRMVAAVLCAICAGLTLRDLSTSDSMFGNRLYRGEGTLVPVFIGLAFTVAFGALVVLGSKQVRAGDRS